MRFICGIDEAGRGALLGPLVVAGVSMPQGFLPWLEGLGVKDSKLLSHPAREKLFHAFIARGITFFYSHISPARIDNTSLTVLEQQESIKIINALAPHKVLLDVPARGRGIERYCQIIALGIAPTIEVIGGNKFDAAHPVVSAASVVAKVMRERAIAVLKKEYGDFGSGYPNRRTVLYTQAHYDKLRPIIRTKWRIRYKK